MHDLWMMWDEALWCNFSYTKASRQLTNATHPFKHNNQAIYLETSIVTQSVLMSREPLLQRV